MASETEKPRYLTCERREIYALLMLSAGMMGAYTYNMRGGVFCNAQTANMVLMAVEFGHKDISGALYYLIPFTAYCLGSFISEALPSPVKKLGFLRWDTYLIAFEMLVFFSVGFIPLEVPDHVVQIIINFVAAMQYNTFRQMEGIPMATTFCTNHVRQVGIALAKIVRKRDMKAARRGLVHFCMLVAFLVGGVVLTAFCQILQEKAIWIAIIPTMIVFIALVRADLTSEHDMLDRKPSGH